MVGSFELLHCFSKKFERMARATIDGMFPSAKEEATKVGSTATVSRNSLLIISYITFWDSRGTFFSDDLSRNSCLLQPKNCTQHIFDVPKPLVVKDLLQFDSPN